MISLKQLVIIEKTILIGWFFSGYNTLKACQLSQAGPLLSFDIFRGVPVTVRIYSLHVRHLWPLFGRFRHFSF